MPTVEIYSKAHCPFCDRAKKLLTEKGVEYQELVVDEDAELLKDMLARSEGRRTVPQIFINGEGIGGFDDMKALEMSGELDKKLSQS